MGIVLSSWNDRSEPNQSVEATGARRVAEACGEMLCQVAGLSSRPGTGAYIGVRSLVHPTAPPAPHLFHK